MPLSQVESEAEGKMKKTLESFRKELASMRTGRATPALLDRIMVDYYGSPMPVNQVATISVPEPQLLVIQPWDRSMVNAIEKAILKSDLGLTPSSDGTVIRLPIPSLTEERRKDLCKAVKKKAEETKVAIRNIRREANDELKSLEKELSISEDETKRRQEEIQKLTDRFVQDIDNLAQAKEKEIMSL
ncbi:MAG: ribosome recycling factor [Firmicutes bacterium]|jgi:ribosome recycling factor|nr:ribosome recycling factor [Bacillota bacterium]